MICTYSPNRLRKYFPFSEILIGEIFANSPRTSLGNYSNIWVKTGELKYLHFRKDGTPDPLIHSWVKGEEKNYSAYVVGRYSPA